MSRRPGAARYRVARRRTPWPLAHGSRMPPCVRPRPRESQQRCDERTAGQLARAVVFTEMAFDDSQRFASQAFSLDILVARNEIAGQVADDPGLLARMEMIPGTGDAIGLAAHRQCVVAVLI